MHVKYSVYMFLFLLSCDLLDASYMSICKNKQQCQDLKNSCQCYCSRKCGPRDKKPDDKPVFVADDPRGYRCYCKQWDLDHVDECNPIQPPIDNQ